MNGEVINFLKGIFLNNAAYVHRCIQSETSDRIIITIIFLSSPKDRFSLLLEREGGREGERERNIIVREEHGSAAFSSAPRLGIKPVNFQSVG